MKLFLPVIVFHEAPINKRTSLNRLGTEPTLIGIT